MNTYPWLEERYNPNNNPHRRSAPAT
ncbi:MAG: hypothetical protein QOJ14_894, partial [Thermoleophilaceae bacterium]|nr:hypothetical protein [Thermoleophilaceae bacterium]